VLTMDTKCPNQVFCVWLVLNAAWKRDSLQINIFANICSTWSMIQLITRFETWITRNDVNGVSWFHLSYLVTLMSYLCSQWTPKYQIKYFIFDWSIYTLFVLNKSLKREFLEIMMFVHICSTWSIVELKTRFETWITRKALNGVRLLSYLI
jgi:hypothetical protein